jgi:hypothetical protein
MHAPTNIKIMVFLLISHLSIAISQAQPYLDLAQASYHTSSGSDPKEFEHFRAQANLPVIFKDSSIFLFNPIWEQRWLKIKESDTRSQYRGLVAWFTYTKRLGKKWESMLAIIPRFNGESEVQFKEGYQTGGAFLFTYKKRPGLAYKFGLYYNNEFFGNFFMPLLGIDWKINDRQRLFGVFPGYVTDENRISKKIYWGGNFRTFTNSYKLYNPPGSLQTLDYIRIDDNQLGAYLDFYLTPKIVFNVESGYSIMRKLSKGVTKSDEKYTVSEHDGIYLRATLQYRMRFE